jgi:hypothetical protein
MWLDDDDEYPCVYISVFLEGGTWRRRFWSGLKHMFGYNCRYGHFDEFILRPEDCDRLIRIIESLKSFSKKGAGN